MLSLPIGLLAFLSILVSVFLIASGYPPPLPPKEGLRWGPFGAAASIWPPVCSSLRCVNMWFRREGLLLLLLGQAHTHTHAQDPRMSAIYLHDKGN
jgi:hypothetical protein